MKKLLMLLASLVMVFSAFNVALANDDYSTMLISAQDNSIKVMQDGEYIDFTDANGIKVEPQIINSRTMVPFRKIFNSLGVTDDNITWVAETRTVIAKKDNVEIELQIDNNVAKKTVDGVVENITLDSAPVIYENRTLVPVRFIAESMEKLVGWDADNRTVIIIDMAKIEKQIEAAMPKYMELVSLQTTVLNTFDTSMELKGEIAYTSEAEKENNSNLKFEAIINVIKTESELYLDLEIEFSGKGVLYEALEENNITKIDVKIIFTENKMYVISSLLEELAGEKWIVMEDDSLTELTKMLNMGNSASSLTELIEVAEENLNIYTYEQIQLMIELFERLLGDDKITISGSTTKKYKIEIDFLDLLEFFSEYGVDITGAEVFKKTDIVSGGTIKDGVADTSYANIEFEIAEDGEEIIIEIDAESKVKSYNQTYEISIPNEDETMVIE